MKYLPVDFVELGMVMRRVRHFRLVFPWPLPRDKGTEPAGSDVLRYYNQHSPYLWDLWALGYLDDPSLHEFPPETVRLLEKAAKEVADETGQHREHTEAKLLYEMYRAFETDAVQRIAEELERNG